MTHGMVLLPIRLNGVLDNDKDAIVSTCLCGWFGSILHYKVDMAAFQWREHMGLEA
jgi:hypothetical protein